MEGFVFVRWPITSFHLSRHKCWCQVFPACRARVRYLLFLRFFCFFFFFSLCLHAYVCVCVCTCTTFVQSHIVSSIGSILTKLLHCFFRRYKLGDDSWFQNFAPKQLYCHVCVSDNKMRYTRIWHDTFTLSKPQPIVEIMCQLCRWVQTWGHKFDLSLSVHGDVCIPVSREQKEGFSSQILGK